MTKGTRTMVLLDTTWSRVQELVRARIREGASLADLAACVVEQDGAAHLVVDRCHAIVKRLREDFSHPPLDAIRVFETEAYRDGHLRMVTMTPIDGWATHWVQSMPLTHGGDA